MAASNEKKTVQATVGKRLVVYSVKRTRDDRSIWVRAGSAFVNRDGSINLILDVLPLDGKLHVREPKADTAEGDATESSEQAA